MGFRGSVSGSFEGLRFQGLRVLGKGSLYGFGALGLGFMLGRTNFSLGDGGYVQLSHGWGVVGD